VKEQLDIAIARIKPFTIKELAQCVTTHQVLTAIDWCLCSCSQQFQHWI